MVKRDGFFDAIGERRAADGPRRGRDPRPGDGRAAAAAGDPPKGDSTATAEKLIKAAGFAPDDVGYLVVDLKDKRVLAEHNPDRPFIPASVAKIATVVPALEVLGGDHRFTTTAQRRGQRRRRRPRPAR